jgi:hypothetical protein
MQPLGYLYKRVERRPDWLEAPNVTDVFALSGCVSPNFADYINYWKHNGFWLFDTPQVIEALAAEHSIPLEGMRLFYYEAHELEYNVEERAWFQYEPVSEFGVNVAEPKKKTLEGFDVVSFSVGSSPECSPLSCNSCAEELSTNEHCLFRTFEEAKLAIESDRFHGCEPGPYRIVAVYSVFLNP